MFFFGVSTRKTIVILLFAYVFNICQAQRCTPDGWFGPECQYQCHCAGSAVCDQDDGSCGSTGCDDNWFGPACQYNRMGFFGPSWLTDGDNGNCNTGTSDTVTVTLNTPIPITWVRVVFNDAAHLNQIELNYIPPSTSTRLACPNIRRAKVDDKTEDIFCSTSDTVTQLVIFGEAVRGLCSLYISGGRNGALNQPAQQSSRYIPTTGNIESGYLAEYAVDGRTGADAQNIIDIQSTCTHTDISASRGTWTVDFRQALDIIWFHIYNRNFRGCCPSRLAGFSLRAYPESGSGIPETYPGPWTSRNSYTVVPSPRISFPVGQVQIEGGQPVENTLTLCEVFVYGESSCSPRQFGLRCERLCNCLDQTESCFVHSGGCPSGCAAGFTGEDCYTGCGAGKYGVGCEDTCSVHCAGEGNPCDSVSGQCINGCDPGYRWQKCNEQCATGTYGDGCSPCNTNCRGSDNACGHVDGTCTNGCETGYRGNMCELECATGTYGDGCSTPCNTNCRGSDNACDHVNGTCTNGCENGYRGSMCELECSTGFYGEACRENCSDHCAGDQNSCHHVNGTCDSGCDPGYQGSFCDQQCNVSTWGQNCSNNCSTACSDSMCDHETGRCTCLPGYWGASCDQKCNRTTFGAQCAESCNSNCLHQECDHMDGTCATCVDGWTGESCDTLEQSPQAGGGGDGGSGGSIVPAVAGAVAAGVVILAIVAAVLLWRRRRVSKASNNEAENGNNLTRETVNVHFANFPSKAGLEEDSDEKSGGDDNMAGKVNILSGNTAVSVETLPTYILQHLRDSHFKDEFSSIPMASSAPQTIGLFPENFKKNRYKNIIPYDSSRVLLQVNKDNEQSDYINASYVKGYKNDRAFIASQGPNDLILFDFLRMLWEQKVDRVVMLTNLIELGKRKCTMYWPSEGQEDFGDISVRILTTHVFAEYTIRHFRLSKSGESPRDLTQFHYTAWPDKSVPESPWGLADLYQRIRSTPGTGPLLVHCSAGVGRTGTFIALCNLLEEVGATGKMDFLSTLWKLRQDRMHTIQNIEQYIFLHKVALVGHVISGTTIQVKDMYARLTSLESDKGDGTLTHSYKQEFDAVLEVCYATTTVSGEVSEPQEENVYQNTSSSSKNKNRLSNILPNQAFQPVLAAETHKEDTYINAVLVPNLNKNSQDILTQVPMHTTVTDFWRMVIQYSVGLVVAFDTDSSRDETIGEFLPKNREEPFENERYRVEITAATDSDVAREFSLTVHQKIVPEMDSSAKPVTKTLTFLECNNIDQDGQSVLQLYEKIAGCRPSGKSRIVYMCRNGADQSGLMCVQSILLDRLEVDQCLTVPLVVGTIKAIRPQVIPTVDQYKSLYRVLKLARESQNVYGNMSL